MGTESTRVWRMALLTISVTRSSAMSITSPAHRLDSLSQARRRRRACGSAFSSDAGSSKPTTTSGCATCGRPSGTSDLMSWELTVSPGGKPRVDPDASRRGTAIPRNALSARSGAGSAKLASQLHHAARDRDGNEGFSRAGSRQAMLW